MSKEKKTVIYLYNKLLDPVIQSNLLLYIKDIAKNQHDKYQFTIVSYEENNELTSGEKETIKKELKDINIFWEPLNWHQGKEFWKKAYDLLICLWVIFKLRIKGYKYIISLGTISGSFAYILSKLFFLKLYLYQYEPHSEYGLDSNFWSEKSVKYKLLKWLEYRSAKSARVISTGTKHMIKRLNDWKIKAAVYKIPSVVNQDKFIFSGKDRAEVRRKHGISENTKVILYTGKFGGLYYYEETATLFRCLLGWRSDLHILIVTLNPIEEIEKLMADNSCDMSRITITQSKFDFIQTYLSASDFGIIAVPPGPSKKFVSNIKVGEYLSSGLPYLIPRGVSEDDWYAENYNIGAVVKDFSESEILKALPKIDELLNETPDELKGRCREIGIEYRGFKNLNRQFKNAFTTLVK